MITRRELLAYSTGSAAAIVGSRVVPAWANTDVAMKAVLDFTGGKPPMAGNILEIPKIAEDGNTVPISILVDSPMTAGDHVQSVAVFADGNPNLEVMTFNFSPMSGEATATTRMRLAKSQNVYAVAKTSTGKAIMDKKAIKVTIGGCGG